MVRFLIRTFVFLMRLCGYPYTFVRACDANVLQKMAATGAKWWAEQAQASDNWRYAPSKHPDALAQLEDAICARIYAVLCQPGDWGMQGKVNVCTDYGQDDLESCPSNVTWLSRPGLPDKTRMEFDRLAGTIIVINRRTDQPSHCLMSCGMVQPNDQAQRAA